jgi:small subunit ribosomal protein S16
MLMIRLQRIGRKHEPAFRLVLTDSKNSTKSGKFLEILGNYDARRGEKSEFKAERISYWMGQGAQVSHTVHNLLIDKKITTGKKINTLPKKSAPQLETAAPTEPVSNGASQSNSTEVPVAEEVTSTPIAEEAVVETPAPAEEVVA